MLSLDAHGSEHGRLISTEEQENAKAGIKNS
jgi:hypothetical protein